MTRVEPLAPAPAYACRTWQHSHTMCVEILDGSRDLYDVVLEMLLRQWTTLRSHCWASSVLKMLLHLLTAYLTQNVKKKIK